jgi:dienelactone hydrolase
MKRHYRKFYGFSVLLALAILLPATTWAEESIKVRIPSHGFFLDGKLFAAKGPGPFPTLLLNHGYPGGSEDVLGLGSKLSEAGINVLCFNVRGTHRSDGEFSFPNSQEDIGAALNFLAKEEITERFKIDATKIILGGYSFGGGMSLTYAAHNPEIKRIISIAGTDHGELVRTYQTNPKFKEMIDAMVQRSTEPGGPVRSDPKSVFQELIDNVDYFDHRKTSGSLIDKDILIFGGWEDVNVTVDNFLLPFYRALRNAGAQKVRFIVYHDNHSFRNNRETLATDIIRWIKQSYSSN